MSAARELEQFFAAREEATSRQELFALFDRFFSPDSVAEARELQQTRRMWVLGVHAPRAWAAREDDALAARRATARFGPGGSWSLSEAWRRLLGPLEAGERQALEREFDDWETGGAGLRAVRAERVAAQLARYGYPSLDAWQQGLLGARAIPLASLEEALSGCEDAWQDVRRWRLGRAVAGWTGSLSSWSMLRAACAGLGADAPPIPEGVERLVRALAQAAPDDGWAQAARRRLLTRPPDAQGFCDLLDEEAVRWGAQALHRGALAALGCLQPALSGWVWRKDGLPARQVPDSRRALAFTAMTSLREAAAAARLGRLLLVHGAGEGFEGQGRPVLHRAMGLVLPPAWALVLADVEGRADLRCDVWMSALQLHLEAREQFDDDYVCNPRFWEAQRRGGEGSSPANVSASRALAPLVEALVA